MVQWTGPRFWDEVYSLGLEVCLSQQAFQCDHQCQGYLMPLGGELDV